MSRIEFQEKCPQCQELMDYYDDKDNLAFGGFCQNCGFEDQNDYYKLPNGETVLLTKKEAEQKGIIKRCKQCDDVIYEFEDNNSGLCIVCQALEETV